MESVLLSSASEIGEALIQFCIAPQLRANPTDDRAAVLPCSWFGNRANWYLEAWSPAVEK